MKFQMSLKIESTGSIEFLKEFCGYCYTEYEKKFNDEVENTDSITHYMG